MSLQNIVASSTTRITTILKGFVCTPTDGLDIFWLSCAKALLCRIHQNDSDSRKPDMETGDDKSCVLEEFNSIHLYGDRDVLEETPQEICIDQYNKSNVPCTITPDVTEIENVSQYQTTATDVDNGRINGSSMDNEYPAPILTEPTPPQIRNSKQLFELIKARVGASNLSWSALPSIDKRHYQKAVYQLKKDYIRNYKMYLESLSPKELFEYYHTFVY